MNIAQFHADARSSRFAEEGAQEKYVSFVKQLTSKPVVGVGRFTSPDTMLHQINGGILDLIGAARPSIADPFLPRKIEEGRIDDIRECIGCNVCVLGDALGVPIRCTQNPTMGEEWRRGWHPERIVVRTVDETVLVVGAGPAGLEAARALGQRGHRVALAEATIELGGRVLRESRLPGLAVWGRVRDYRVSQIDKMTNVEIYRDSRLTEEEILEFGFDHVCIATGASWRRDGRGGSSFAAIEGWEQSGVFTPDDVMAGAALKGPVILYDDDHFYMGGVIAEKLRADGHEVTLVTTAGSVSRQTEMTLEQPRIQARILDLGIQVVTAQRVTAFDGRQARLACVYTDRESFLDGTSLVVVTSRQPADQLHAALCGQPDRLSAAGIKTLRRIGDCNAPNIIAAAVHAGHRYAREIGEPAAEVARDRVVVGG